MSCIGEMPKSVQNAFTRAVVERDTYWVPIVRLAITEGVTDPNKLADIPFYLERPELMNRALKSHETKLVRAWTATRDNLIDYVKAVLRSTADPDLTAWITNMKTSWIKPYMEHENARAGEQRKKDKEKMREFMIKASAAPDQYDTVYRTYTCYNNFGVPHGAAQRGHQVHGFKKSGSQNALLKLQNSTRKLDRDFRRFHIAFGDMEFDVYNHVDVVSRWVSIGATNDGPTVSNDMEKELNWMLSQSRRSKSIYSVYRSLLIRTDKIFNDDSPHTAGMWSGLGTWDEWKENFDFFD